MNIVETLIIHNRKCEKPGCEARAGCKYNQMWLCGKHVAEIELKLKEKNILMAKEIFENG